MRIAVVMPRGCALDPARLNSMETVALTLNRASRFGDATRFVHDGPGNRIGQGFTVRHGLGRTAHVAAVLDRLRSWQPDIVECHQQLWLASGLAQGLPSARHVLYRHTDLEEGVGPLSRWRRGRQLDRLDRVVCVSRTAAAALAQSRPGLEPRIAIVGNPVSAADWNGRAEMKEPLILFSGRASADKGLDVFCEAAERVLSKRPSWRAALMLADWDRHRAWASPHLDRLSPLGGRVEIVRSASPQIVRDAVRRAAIAVVPSRVPETFGLSAVEAHLGAAAVISSGAGALAEVSGPHALYCRPGDVSGLEETMLSLIDDDRRRIDLARAGQAHAVVAHAPEARAAELDAFRLDLLNHQTDAGRPSKARVR